MTKKCDFCYKESRGETTIDNRWTFRNCGSNECKRKQTTIIKLLTGDLSNKTVLAIARTIPDKELYHKEKEEKLPTKKDPNTVEKLFGIGKGIFKKRKEIFED